MFFYEVFPSPTRTLKSGLFYGIPVISDTDISGFSVGYIQALQKGLDSSISLLAKECDYLNLPVTIINRVSRSCRSQMNLSTEDNQIANAFHANQIITSATCDYGNPDASKTNCPAALEDSRYKFQGISSW